MVTVYGIKSCNTCRKARKFLTGKHIEHRFHDIREDGLDIQTLERWGNRVKWEVLLNKQSPTWRRLPEVDRADMNRDRAFAAMIDQPTLLKRPSLESDEFIAVGFSAKRFSEYLAKMV